MLFLEPIISPWIIYAVSLLDKINAVATFIAVVSGVLAFLSIIGAFLEEDEKCKRIFKKCTIVAVIAGTIGALVPDKQLMLTMLAAQYVTPDNIQAVQGNIVDFVGQLSDAVKNGAK